MKKNFMLAAIFSLFVLAVSASAQETATAAVTSDKAANFSGTWTLDVGKSKLGDRNMIESQTLTVTQTDKELKVETSTKRLPPPADAPQGGGGGGRMGGGGMMGGGDAPATYSLDGKETKTERQGPMGSIPVTMKAKIEGSKLHLSSSSTFTTPNGEMTMSSKESWSLSADGATLTIDSTRTTPRGDMSATKVFTKKQ